MHIEDHILKEKSNSLNVVAAMLASKRLSKIINIASQRIKRRHTPIWSVHACHMSIKCVYNSHKYYGLAGHMSIKCATVQYTTVIANYYAV